MKTRLALLYGGLVGVPLAVMAWVVATGRGAAPPAAAADIAGAAAVPGISGLALLVTQIGVIIVLSRVIGWLAESIRQPRVIGEVLAGILLGPSLLGWAAPGVSGFLFPASSFGALNALSQLGLVLFMFMVGLELDLREIGDQGRLAILVSHASIAMPMALGALLAVYLYPRLSDASVGFAGFALFMGAAMSVTAFPVLARILAEQGLLRSRLGSMAIACAAIGDATGWCLLAYIVAQIRAGHAAVPVGVTVAGLLLFVALMFGPARAALRRVEAAYLEQGELPESLKALLLVVLLASALATELLGLHLLFGAFVAGAVMPRNRQFLSYLIHQFESLTMLLLMPLFFAYTGLRTNIGQVRGAGMWWLCLLIIAVAVAGKAGGAGFAARLGGMGWRESAALGALMNTRGLMELVVLNIGLEIKVISPALFSMMIVMAIATTMMAPPLLHWIWPAAVREKAERPSHII